jgi:hypothetical protein
MNAAARFFAKVTPDPTGSGCLLWTGALDTNGYGRFQDADGRNMPAHRWLLERVFGPNRDKVTDHLCRVTACVRPSHLEFVTPAENIRRGVGPARWKAKAAARTHCAQGHPFAGANLYIYFDKTGKRHRRCNTCARANGSKPSGRPWRALNQRCIRANRKLLAGRPRVAILHSPRGPRVHVEVFVGDTAAEIDAARDEAIAIYNATVGAVRGPS